MAQNIYQSQEWNLNNQIISEIFSRNFDGRSGARVDPDGLHGFHKRFWAPSTLIHPSNTHPTISAPPNPSTNPGAFASGSGRTLLTDALLTRYPKRIQNCSPNDQLTKYGILPENITPIQHMINRGYYIEFLINKVCISEIDNEHSDLGKLLESHEVSFTYCSRADGPTKFHDRWAAMSATNLDNLVCCFIVIAYVCRRKFIRKRTQMDQRGDRERNPNNFARTTFKLLFEHDDQDELSQIVDQIEQLPKLEEEDEAQTSWAHDEFIPDSCSSFEEMFELCMPRLKDLSGEHKKSIDRALQSDSRTVVEDGKLRCFIGDCEKLSEDLSGRYLYGVVSDVKADPIISMSVIHKAAMSIIKSNRKSPNGYRIGAKISMCRNTGASLHSLNDTGSSCSSQSQTPPAIAR